MKEADNSVDAIDESEMHAHSATVHKVKAAMPDEDLLVDVSEFFKVFGDSTRAKILAALSVSEMCVACITEILNMNVSAVSHQLRILRQSKLVRTRRAGKENILFAGRRPHRQDFEPRAGTRYRAVT